MTDKTPFEQAIFDAAVKQFPNTMIRLEDTPAKVELCVYCRSPKIYKYNGKSEPICRECALGIVKQKPVIYAQLGITKIGNNESCPCGKADENGKPVKYKKCCKGNEQKEEKEIYNNTISQT